MFEMYRNLLPIANECKEEEKTCIENYQKTKDPTFLSKMFIVHFPIYLQIVDLYWGVSSEDKASFCIEELHKAMLDYNSERNVKFSSFSSVYLRNRLRTETQALSTAKRKMLNNYAELNDSMVIEEDFSRPIIEFDLMRAGLTPNELSYCLFVLNSGNTVVDSDFARIKNISSAAVHYIKNSLKTKLKFLVV